MSDLLTRFTIHDLRTDFSANTTLALLDDLDSELIGFMLDIDAYRTTEFAPDLDLGPALVELPRRLYHPA